MAKKILIVDDDRDFLITSEGLLKRREYEIFTAWDGAQALELAQNKNVDLIITDVLMPEMDGFEFYKRLKMNPATFSIPVVVVSTRGAMEDSFRAIGVDEFLHKPFTVEELISKIGTVIGKIIPVEPESGDNGEAVDQNHWTILVIGTEQDILKKMSKIVKESCYLFNTASTMAEAVSKINKFNPEIIFIDIDFSEIQSSELVNTLRYLPNSNKKPIIGYSAKHITDHSDKEDLETISDMTSFIHAGANKYIGPYNDYNFINTLSQYLVPVHH